jgi:hypothetical protein
MRRVQLVCDGILGGGAPAYRADKEGDEGEAGAETEQIHDITFMHREIRYGSRPAKGDTVAGQELRHTHVVFGVTMSVNAKATRYNGSGILSAW